MFPFPTRPIAFPRRRLAAYLARACADLAVSPLNVLGFMGARLSLYTRL